MVGCYQTVPAVAAMHSPPADTGITLHMLLPQRGKNTSVTTITRHWN